MNLFFRLWILVFIVQTTSIFSFPVKAILFDVFGTCVQVEESLVSQGEVWSKTHGVDVNWRAFVRAWMLDHVTTIDEIRKGKLPFRTVDQIHQDSIRRLLPKYVNGPFHLTQENYFQVAHFWHQLKPWSDVRSSLERLKTQFQIAPLSNGNQELLANLAKFGGLPWEIYFSAEQVKHYKPDDQVYAWVEKQLGFPSSQLMLVASHEYDLRAARKRGWKTAFVIRSDKRIRETCASDRSDREFDFVVNNFNELADLILD